MRSVELAYRKGNHFTPSRPDNATRDFKILDKAFKDAEDPS
jgi:hypothetical protein